MSRDTSPRKRSSPPTLPQSSTSSSNNADSASSNAVAGHSVSNISSPHVSSTGLTAHGEPPTKVARTEPAHGRHEEPVSQSVSSSKQQGSNANGIANGVVNGHVKVEASEASASIGSSGALRGGNLPKGAQELLSGQLKLPNPPAIPKEALDTKGEIVEESDPFEESVPGTNLLKAQKAAIWAQMQHYRRLAQETHEYSSTARQQIAAIHSLILAFAANVSSSVEKYIITSAKDSSDGLSVVQAGPLELASVTIPPSVTDELPFIAVDPISDVKDEFKNSSYVRNAALTESIKSSLSKVFFVLDKLPKIKTSAGSNHADNDTNNSEKQQEILDALTEENSKLQALINRQKMTIEELKEDASLQTTHRLLVERRLDKMRADHILNGGDAADLDGASTGAANGNIPIGRTESAASAVSTANGDMDVKSVQRAEASDTENAIAQANAEAFGVIAEKRLEELLIEKKKYTQLLEERNKLALTVDEIKASTKSLLEYPEFKKLEAERQFLFGENGVLKDKILKLTEDITELQTGRQKFKESIEAEHKEQIQKLKALLDKTNDDLDRIRAQRDQLESKTLEYQQKEKTEIMSHSAAVQLSESRKLVIESLKHRVTRLTSNQESLPANSMELIKFLVNNFDNVDITTAVQEELIADKENVTKLIKLLNDNGIDENGSPVKRSLTAKNGDDETKEQIISRYEKNIQTYMGEIDSITEAYSKVVKTNTDVVAQLESLESTVTQLRSEKDEISKRYANNNKLLYTRNQTITTLKKMQEKQLEQTKLLIQSENNLHSQITELESKLANKKAIYDKYQLELTASTQLLQDYKMKNDQLIKEASKAEGLIKENNKLYEEESIKRQLAEEKAAVLEKKLDGLSGHDTSNEIMQLKKELEHWKLCMKCSSCTTEFKSHVLTRCMHVFCKNCVNKMYESRQRKCPSCGEQFGKNDIRQIFL